MGSIGIEKLKKIIISEHLDNDMAQEVIDNHLLFYLDDHTWIKVDDMTNDYLIRLQLLHLKIIPLLFMLY